MTEAEWMGSTEPAAMLGHLQGKVSDRKLWLFTVACCRLRDGVSAKPENKQLLDHIERETDAPFGLGEVGIGLAMTATVGKPDVVDRIVRMFGLQNPWMTAKNAAFSVPRKYWNDDQESWTAGYRIVRGMVREIFGHPFRPVTLDAAWLTSNVTTLAAQMYESRDFSAMPILADALQDAGCENDNILNHCRGPGPHVRGCWVVDLMLGKA